MLTQEQVLADLKKIPGLQPYLQFSTDNQTPIDDRLFAHIHLSQEMAGLTRYQGHQPEVTTKYAAQILRNFIQHSKQKGIWFEHVKQAAADLETACQEKEELYKHRNTQDDLIQYLEKRLKKKSRILFPLVWVSDYETRQSHGVLVEFEKSNDYQYVIRVMNAGEGLEHHVPGNEAGTSNTVSEYRYDKAQFQEVIQKLQPNFSRLNADNFYDALSLNGTHHPCAPADASKTMLTGMCTWKMIIAFLKHRLHNHTAFLRLKQEVETQSLLDYLLLFINKPTAARANHLELAMNNYARFLTEKIKDLNQHSVQNGLQLCQYIAKVLREKDWLKPTHTLPSHWVVRNISSNTKLPQTATDSTLNPTRTLYTRASDRTPCRVGIDLKTRPETISKTRSLIDFINQKLLSMSESEQKSPTLYKRYLDDTILHLPSIDGVYKQDSHEAKEKDLIRYAQRLKLLQEKYREQYANIDEPHKSKVSPEYVLCSAKLFLEMLKTAHLYFGSDKIELPHTLHHTIRLYTTLLNSMQFYQMTQELSDIRKTCLDELNGYGTNFNYRPGHGKQAYYALKKNFLQQRHGIEDAHLLEIGRTYLQRFAKNKSEPVSKQNPADAAQLTTALSKASSTHAERRIQDGKPLSDSTTLCSIENIEDLILDNSARFVPDFSDDARFIDVIWDFFYSSNGCAYLDRLDKSPVIGRQYAYNEQTGISPQKNHILIPNTYKEVAVYYCDQHQQLSEKCTDTHKKVKMVKTEQSPCVLADLKDDVLAGGKYSHLLTTKASSSYPPPPRRCKRHNKDWGSCNDTDKQVYDRRVEDSPCRPAILRDTAAYDYQYQSNLSLEVTGYHPIFMNDFAVHASRAISTEAVIDTDAVNHDICRRLNSAKGSQFSVDFEHSLSISSAIGDQETHIENILQYYEKNFSLLIRNVRDRERLCLILLKADSLKTLAIKNPNIDHILHHFFLAYQEHVNLQVLKEPGSENFLHFLSVFCYQQLPDRLKPTLENQLHLSSTHPWGQLTSLYYRMQTDISGREAECLVAYYSALNAYSQMPHARTAPEERMLSQLQYQIVNLYSSFITDSSNQADGAYLAKRGLLINETQKWLQSIAKYQTFRVHQVGPEQVDATTSSSTFFVITGLNQTLRLNLATGLIEDGGPEKLVVPAQLKLLFPEQLKGVTHLDFQSGKYYLNHHGIEYCFVMESNAWKIYQKIDNQWFKKIQHTDLTHTNQLPNQLFPTIASEKDAEPAEQPKYDYWCRAVRDDQKETLYIVDRQTKQPAYRCTKSSTSNEIKVMKQVAGQWKALRLFQSNFESQYLAEAFETDQSLAFPRYGLAFRESFGKQVWTKNEQYSLVNLSQIELGESFTQFLGLASQDGQKRKALIPCQSYIYDFDKKGVFLDTSGLVDAENALDGITTGITAEIRGNSVFHQPNSAHHIECDVDEHGKLSAKKLSDKLYLLYLFLGQSDYTRAFEIFQEIELAGYYSVDKTMYSHFRKILLEDIPFRTRECDQTLSGDDKKEKIYLDSVLKNGKRAAIQLKMLVNLLSISLCNQSGHTEKLLEMFNAETLSALLNEYSKGYSNTPAEMQLTSSEKMTLLNFMSSKSMDTEPYLSLAAFAHQKNDVIEAQMHSVIPWKTGEVPHDSTRFVASTLFQRDDFGVDRFSQATKEMLKAFDTTEKALVEGMRLDDAYGEVLYRRAIEFNDLCVETAKSLPSHLEENILPQFDQDIKKERRVLLALAFKNQTSVGEQTVGHVAKVLGRKRAKTTFRTLIQLFIQNNPEAYRHQLGALTDEEINEITVRTANLLLLLTSRKYYARLVPELEKAKRAGDNDKVGELLQEHRVYELDDPNARYYLAYEYLSGILIRDSQMRMLTPLLEKKDDSEEHKKYVFQLIMGGGKSKVLMPVSSFLKANGENLVTVVVPDSLFETNLNDLSRYSQVNFNQKAVPLRFKRSDAKDLQKLENIRDRLKEVIINKDYIVTTKTTLQSIELSYLSLLASDIDQPTAQSIELLEEILTIVQEKSDVFIDEIDTNLSCFDELNYTLNYLHYPPEYLVTLQVKFFEFLCKDQKGPKSSFYDQLMAPNITLDKAAFNGLLSEIVRKMADDPDSVLHTALKGLKEPSRAAIIAYLAENSKDVKLPSAFQACDESKKRIIGFCKAQFNSILPLILSKEENVNYGFSRRPEHTELVDQEIAIPYAGNNNPRENSRFASLYETFGYTTVAQLKRGISKASLEKYLDAFIEQYESQSSDVEKQQLARALFEELHINPDRYSVQSIIEKDPAAIHAIWDTIKENRAVVLLISQKLILNKIKLYPFMLNSNSSDFTSMLHVIQGASGTIDNPGILDPDITFKKSLSMGTDGKTIAILRSKARPDILNVDTKNAQIYLEQLSAQSPDFHEYQAIIDIGSHFTGVSNQTVAEQIAAFYTAFYTAHPNPNQYKYVLYFNQDNILCALPIHGGERIELGSSDAEVIKSKLGCGPSEYFAYFDQIHTVGTDLPLAKASIGSDLLPAKTSGAKAFVSFSPTTTQQALLQGVMRARDLAASQNVAFVGNAALHHYLDTQKLPHNKESILMIARENLIDQIHEGAFRAANQKIKAIYRRALLNKVKKASTLEEKQRLLKHAEGLVFSKTELDPSKLFLGDHTTENTQIILENLAKSYADKSSPYEYDAETLRKIKADVQSVIQHCVRYCREKTVHSSYPAAQAEVELQAEAELQQEAQVKAEAEKRNELELARLDARAEYTPRVFQPLPSLSVLGEQLFSQHRAACLNISNELTRFGMDHRALGIEQDSIQASPNLLVSNQNNRILSQPAVKTCYHVLWIENKATTERKVVLLSERDAELYRATLNDASLEPSPHYLKYNFALKTMSGDTTCMHSNITEDEDWQNRMHQVRFLTGQIHENNAWIWKERTQEKLEFYRKFILPYHPRTENTLLFLEQKLKKIRQAQNILESKPREQAITPPWMTAQVSFRPGVANQAHQKHFSKAAVAPPAPKLKKGYVPATYKEITIRSMMHRWLSFPIIGFFIGCIAALVLVIKTYSIKRQIKRKKLDTENITYQAVERLKHPLRWKFFTGSAVYRRAIKFYKNTKAQYEQAEANALRQKETADAGNSFQPMSSEQLCELPETAVPLVWGEPALVGSRNNSGRSTPNGPTQHWETLHI